MRQLPRPPLDAEAIYLNISRMRAAAPRNRLLDAQATIFGAYQHYVAASFDVTEVAPAATHPATPLDLTANYDNRASGCLALRSAILANNRGGRCAFCDRTTAITLDHYLPKNHYPEFAVYPLNLIPCCAACNLRKLGRYREQAAIFLHSYFDSIPTDVQVLFADVEVRVDGIVFKYRVNPPEELGVLAGRVNRHFRALALADSYALEAVHETSERTHELRRLHDATHGNAEQISAYLRREAESVAVAKGRNNWRAVALTALAESPEFCAGAFMSVF